MNYPRVLVVALGRINAADAANNGLLLRNIFCEWPKDRLAQIYSSADNGDEGFFGQYYQLGSCDRRFGCLFYRLKSSAQAGVVSPVVAMTVKPATSQKARDLCKSMGKRLLLDTGLYELIFRPVLSPHLIDWVKKFKPDIIFAQGYCLTFTWLPVMLAKHFNLPIAYYPTDDWPNETYRSKASGVPFISRLVGQTVDSSSHVLVAASSVCIAFNRYMQEEYLERYGKNFSVLMHGDEFARFDALQPDRRTVATETWIVCTGGFYENRLSLLSDLDEACEILISRGVKVKASVFPVNDLPKAVTSSFRHIIVEPCPTHNGLAAILKGADILFLPERFDETSEGIRLSVSSKAHLFMLSGRPTIIYSAPVTGIARYAKEENWAMVVEVRSPEKLAEAIVELIRNPCRSEELINNAKALAEKNHNLRNIREEFHRIISFYY